jgi:glycosyltransferase involved in cell wall biosynthesis
VTANPLISIVTVCRNAGAVIGECLSSVADQEFGDVEHVIIDGASSDRTVDLVEAGRRAPGSRISHFVSEPDNGIYDAMNKGARCARGQFLYFLNADDRLFDARTLATLAPLLRTTRASIVHARILIVDHERGTGGVVALPRGLRRTSPLYQGIYHQSVWTRRELYQTSGYFDPSLRLCADVEWLMRALNAGATTEGTDILTTVFRQGGASADVETVRREIRISERRHYSPAEWLWCKGRRRLSRPFLAIGDWLRQ